MKLGIFVLILRLEGHTLGEEVVLPPLGCQQLALQGLQLQLQVIDCGIPSHLMRLRLLLADLKVVPQFDDFVFKLKVLPLLLAQKGLLVVELVGHNFKVVFEFNELQFSFFEAFPFRLEFLDCLAEVQVWSAQIDLLSFILLLKFPHLLGQELVLFLQQGILLHQVLVIQFQKIGIESDFL